MRSLIEGFSGWETFVNEVEQAADEENLEAANAALVCYYLRCVDAPKTWGQLRFVGTFSGQD